MPMKNVSSKTKILLSLLFPILLVSWNLGFDLGAFGSVLYRNVITAWIFAVSTFIALLYARFHDKVAIRFYSFIILAVPILWPAIDYLDHHIPNRWIHYFIIFDYALILFGLLYAAYLFLRIIKTDIFKPINYRNKIFIVFAALFFSGLGFFAGHRNDLFLECSHFKLSGDYIPHNCSRNETSDFRTLYKHVW